MTDDQRIQQINDIFSGALLRAGKIMTEMELSNTRFIELMGLAIGGIMSTAADLSEINFDGGASWLYTEVETMAKNKGISSVAMRVSEGNGHYALSEIAPHDQTRAMNYLGEKMSVALFKGIQELPKPLQTPEMFLRGIEAITANLLTQKFADNDPHDVLEQMTSHIHMAMRDVVAREKGNVISGVFNRAETPHQTPVVDVGLDFDSGTGDETPSMMTDEQFAYIQYLNDEGNKVLDEGGQEALLLSLAEEMPDIYEHLIGLGDEILNDYADQYPGFGAYLRLLTAMAEASRDGVFDDIP